MKLKSSHLFNYVSTPLVTFNRTRNALLLIVFNFFAAKFLAFFVFLYLNTWCKKYGDLS